MLEMILYSISIMYTPGPVTLTATNMGLNRKTKEGLPFYLGIGVAIFVLYILLGYFGNFFLKNNPTFLISLIGSIYMLYLGIKMFKSSVSFEKDDFKPIGFKDGFIMQFFNPKAIIAVLPVVTIYFPASHIDGIKILIMAIFFMILVIGSPVLYAFAGQFFSTFIKDKNKVNLCNKAMAMLIILIGLSTFYHHVIGEI